MTFAFPLKQAFIALPLEGDAKTSFQRLQNELIEFDFLNFQNPDTPHLTLYFWPELMQIEYDRMRQIAEKIKQNTRPFRLSIRSAETFREHGKDHVLYLSTVFSDELAKLKKSLPWPNSRSFVPHITIAHIRHSEKFSPHKKEIMKRLKNTVIDMQVDQLRFYSEINGISQTPIEDFPFQSR